MTSKTQKKNKKLQKKNSKTQKKNRCSGCHNELPKDHPTKTCDKCKERSAQNRALKKKNNKRCRGTKQDGSPCTNKVEKKYGNKYCGKHAKQWKEQDMNGDKNVQKCNSRTSCYPKGHDLKGMKAILPKGWPRKKCENCLRRERQKDKNLRDSKKEQNKKLVEQQSEFRTCTECPKEKMYKVSEMGLKQDGTRSHLCKHHFEKSREAEENRAPRDRIEKRTKEQLKMKNKKYSEKYPDRVFTSYTKCRARQLNENPDKYRKREAACAKKRREKNPERTKELQKKYREEIRNKFKIHVESAEVRGYDNELTLGQFSELVISKCYYCGIKKGNKLLGIDRLDNNEGYIKDNIVACCTICNNMKNTLNEATFILMCAHIFHHNKMLKLDFYPHVFNNYSSPNYNGYKNRAINKKLLFELSKEQFNELSKESPCYICGKYSSDCHVNGIDRYDNSQGYILDNCESCCGDCNFLKKNLDFNVFLFQCGHIALTHRDELDELEKNWTPSRFTKKNIKKLTDEQKAKRTKQKIIDRNNRTMSTKTPEAISKRAAEIKAAHDKKKADEMKANNDKKIEIEKKVLELKADNDKKIETENKADHNKKIRKKRIYDPDDIIEV